MHVFCDFDGTISTVDTTDLVLDRLAGPAWRALEEDWIAGRITAADCMRAQIALIDCDDQTLDAVLDEVEIDPGFPDFVAFCRRRNIALTVVSDGVDRFIARLLSRAGLDDLPVISNRLAGAPSRRTLEQPYMRAGCAAGSGVCKCETTRQASAVGETIAYVGDGRSDFCVSIRADLLFAKDALADYASGRGQPFLPFETFDDVTAALTAFLAPRVAAGL